MKKWIQLVRAAVIVLGLVVMAPAVTQAKSHHYHRHSSNSASKGTGSSHFDQYVHGYTKKNGTYVHGYHRSKANGTKADNYSTKGNVNTYTGKEGTKDPDK